MPEDAASWRPERPAWTQQDELVAMQTELIDQLGRRIVYWLQLNAQPHYRSLRAEVPDALIGPIEHPDRPRPAPAKQRAPRRKRVRMTDLVKRFEEGG